VSIKEKIEKSRSEKKKDKKDLKESEDIATDQMIRDYNENTIEKSPEPEDDFKEAQINEYKTKQVDFSDFDESFKKEFSDYNYPSIDLLTDNEKSHKIDNSDIKNKAKMIEETLKSFGIDGRV